MRGPFDHGRAGQQDRKSNRTNLRALVLAAVAAVTVGALAVGVATGFGAAPDTPYDTQRVEAFEPQADSNFATRSVPANDLTGDGVKDVFVDSYQHDVYKGPGPGCGNPEPNGCEENAGKAYLVSGATGSIVYDITSPELQAGADFGFYVMVPGDVNGDGKDDVVVGANSQDVDATTGDSCRAGQPNCNANQGKAYVFSGPTGRLIRTINNPKPQPNARFGSRLARAGDVTRDGVPDLLMGASSNDVPTPGCGEATPVPAGCRKNEGEAFIFNGATGDLVRTLNLPDAPCENCIFGLAVGGPGDTDGDGVADQFVNAPRANGGVGRSYVFSGATGGLLLRIDDPAPASGNFFGFDVVDSLAPGDVNGDGFADLFAHGFGEDGPNGEDTGGRAWVFNGRTGAVLYEVKDPTPGAGQTFGFAAARTDYNKDGTPDVYVGASPHGGGPEVATLDQNGETHIFDGRDGSLLKSLLLPEADRQPAVFGNSGPNLGIGVGAPGDLNGDGEPDYVAAAFLADADGNRNQGRLYFFRSKVTPPAGGGQTPSPGGGSPPFVGCPAASSASAIRGTAANNRITGTGRADRIVAAGGDDVVDALAGNDCVDLGTGADRGEGGTGNDLMAGGRGNDRISGSSGNDRLRGGPANDRLTPGRGNDRAFGDSGNDLILGSFGNDVLHGVDGNDRISGSRGRDRINGGSGRDVIAGGSSDDRISGDRGNDRINGNSGRDRIEGNSGNDRITSRDGGRDRVNCGSGRDSVLADRIDRVARNCERVKRVRRR